MNLQNWFMGVVEETSDPLGMGRVKVRCFGYHTPDEDLLPTSELPWTAVLLSPSSPSVGGAGGTSGLMVGSMVFGAFYDGSELQDAVILGVVPGGVMPELPRGTAGSSFGGLRPGAGLPALSDVFGNNRRSGSVVQSATGNTYTEMGFYDHGAPTALPGDVVGKLLTIAQSQLNVRATSRHQGPGIQKYWSATSYGPSGYANREPWCAAFCSWVTKTAGILPDNKLPNTAGAFAFATQWAKHNPDVARLRSSPSQIKAGDFVTFSWSHIGIAEKDAAGGYVQTIEGNTSAGGVYGVHRRNRALSGIKHVVAIEATGLSPQIGGPDNRNLSEEYEIKNLTEGVGAQGGSDSSRLSELMEGGSPRSRSVSSRETVEDPHKDDLPTASGSLELPSGEGSISAVLFPET